MSVSLNKARRVLVETSEIGSILKSIKILHSKYGIIPDQEQFNSILEDLKSDPNRYQPCIADAIAIAQSLSDEACDALAAGAEKIKWKLRDIYLEGGLSTSDKQRDADYCIRDYCWHLNQMRKHNGGKLPDRFVRDWELNSCQAFKFS